MLRCLRIVADQSRRFYRRMMQRLCTPARKRAVKWLTLNALTNDFDSFLDAWNSYRRFCPYPAEPWDDRWEDILLTSDCTTRTTLIRWWRKRNRGYDAINQLALAACRVERLSDHRSAWLREHLVAQPYLSATDGQAFCNVVKLLCQAAEGDTGTRAWEILREISEKYVFVNDEQVNTAGDSTLPDTVEE